MAGTRVLSESDWDWSREVAQAEVDRFRRRLSWPGSLTGVSGVYGELSDRSVRMKALGELPLSCLNAALKALSDR